MNAQRLCAAFASTEVAAVERALRKSSFDADGYIFAFQRHADLVRALDLPTFAVGTSYAYLERGEYPEGLAETDLLRA